MTINSYLGSDIDLDIPAEIDGYPVTSIDDYAFQDCQTLGTVRIPDTVTHIGRGAFTRSSVSSVYIPASVTSMGDGSVFAACFEGCSNLSYARYSAGMTSVEGYMFNNCPNLYQVTIPEGVRTISQYAFQKCTSLTLTLPRSLAGVNEYAF